MPRTPGEVEKARRMNAASFLICVSGSVAVLSGTKDAAMGRLASAAIVRETIDADDDGLEEGEDEGAEELRNSAGFLGALSSDSGLSA